MNRFDYFSDIEDVFIYLRGAPLMLSPLDWELIQQWKDLGVPLQVVLRAIEDVFEKHKARKNRRPIRSLSYCKSEVEAEYAEWLAARVGTNEEAAKSDPFPKDKVLTYLHQQITSLEALPIFKWNGVASVAEALSAAYLEFEATPNARKLEEQIGALERTLDHTIAAGATPEQIAEARAAAEALLSPYKTNMLPQVYEQQIDTLFKKHLREFFGVPKLSLFHMR